MPGVPHLPGLGLARDIGHAGRDVWNAVTPRTNEPQGGAPPPMSTEQYLMDIARSFDPRGGPANWLNIASLLFPGGGRGQRLTQTQRAYLQQLNNVRGGKKLTNQPTSIFSQDQRTPYRTMPSRDLFTASEARMEPDIRALSEHLGYTRGNPLVEHLMNHGNTFPQASTKLGLTQDTNPIGGIPKELRQNSLSIGVAPISDHQVLINQLLNKNADNRRN